ncbi:thioredoxin family protein [Candidatus Palauibacter sp.]|uniref:thioredoxin family protein n=1 Tax=Candidatus Palauibacter sp. TaxID=3101350 RepID=UPI003B5C524A
MEHAPLPEDGLAVVVKRDCPTCELVEPVLERLSAEGDGLAVFSQDDPDFPAAVPGVIDDTELEHSFRLDIETVPTLVRFEGGRETGRAVGWDREEWRGLTSIPDLGEDLAAFRPGCGSLSVAPGAAERLRARFGDTGLEARRVALEPHADAVEACFDRGWTDGLPVVPPTPERILRMLAGTSRAPDEIVGAVPPDYAECTVEKVAINAVLAGCKPEYMPVLLAALEAALDPDFTLHGILCSTCFTAPLIIVNGPIARRIGMNSGLNVLGQGNRANATIGRALNLIVQNVGGGRPGEIDRSTFGAPSKYTFCFAEDESDEEWEPLSVSRGLPRGTDAVTLFQGEGVQGIMDQASRTPEELTASLGACLLAVCHPKICEWAHAVLLLSPEHYAIYREAGWDRARITEALLEATTRPLGEVARGAGGLAEGVPDSETRRHVPKFPPGGLLLARAGGAAGLYSAILAGWPGGRAWQHSHPITREIET